MWWRPQDVRDARTTGCLLGEPHFVCRQRVFLFFYFYFLLMILHGRESRQGQLEAALVILCLHMSVWRTQKSSMCCGQQSYQGEVSWALWSIARFIISPRCQIRSYTVWYLPCWVMVRCGVILFSSLCPGPSILEWERSLCAIILSKFVTCFWF